MEPMITSDDSHADLASEAEWATRHSAELSGRADLRHSLDQLSRLSTGRTNLKDTLTTVAQLAVNAIPGADAAGLTLLQEGRADTMVTTSRFAADVDVVQYGLGQGPCVDAVTSGLTVKVDSLGSDKRWLLFGSQAARLNLHSVLSLPLFSADGVVGSMNIYAHAKRAFTDESVAIGELFSVPAAQAVQNAQVLAQTHRLAADLHNALSTRAVIDQAIGVLIGGGGANADEAVASLQSLSRSEHQQLVVVAQKVVDQAVRRARSKPLARPGA